MCNHTNNLHYFRVNLPTMPIDWGISGLSQRPSVVIIFISLAGICASALFFLQRRQSWLCFLISEIPKRNTQGYMMMYCWHESGRDYHCSSSRHGPTVRRVPYFCSYGVEASFEQDHVLQFVILRDIFTLLYDALLIFLLKHLHALFSKQSFICSVLVSSIVVFPITPSISCTSCTQ